MGGRLLSHWDLPEKRISRQEFSQIEKEVVGMLYAVLPPETRIKPLLFFGDKQDFGDMNILVEIPTGTITESPHPWRGKKSMDWKLLIETTFGYKPFHNGDVYSFPFDGFQVDLILASPEIYDCAYNYYAYESGNIQGRVARRLGLKYGHKGLYLNIPLNYFSPELPDHHFREILVTRDSEKIFAMLGFSWWDFRQGFFVAEDMFGWVARSSYFDPKIFAFEELDHQTRTRNRKRPVYHKFLEYCAKFSGDPTTAWYLPSVESVRNEIIRTFPHIAIEIEKARGEILLNAERKAKWNGKIVQELLGLEKEDLGAFMKSFLLEPRGDFEDFNAWLDSKTSEEVKEEILKHGNH